MSWALFVVVYSAVQQPNSLQCLRIKFQAIGSLKKYPLPLESGKEATILDGIGKSIDGFSGEQVVCTPSESFSTPPRKIYTYPEM
jgi:hypothetical protein